MFGAIARALFPEPAPVDESARDRARAQQEYGDTIYERNRRRRFWEAQADRFDEQADTYSPDHFEAARNWLQREQADLDAIAGRADELKREYDT